MFIVKIFVFCWMVFIWTNVALAENQGKVALVMKDLFNPFFQKMEAGAKAYAEKNNISLEVFGVERETQVDRQISIVENLISRKYGAIVIAPADSKKLIPVCKKAMKNGIVVINIDNPFHKATLDLHNVQIPFVGSDNCVGASMVGNYIKSKVGKKGRIIIVEGIRGVENADLRKKGFAESVTSDTEIEIVASQSANWHKDEAFSLVTGLLGQHRNIDAILCANDIMAMGVIQALEMMEMMKPDGRRIWIGAYDNIEEARHEIRIGRMHATIEQHPELMGQYGMNLAVRAMDGNPVPEYTSTPLDLITFDSFAKKIGFSVSSLANPFFQLMVKGSREAGAMFGMELMIADAQNDDARQLLDIRKFILEETDIIILNPTNAETVSTAMEMADAAGIKIITVDRKSSREDLVVSHIASDNYIGGKMAGEFIAKRLQGKGRVMELEGIPGTTASHDRGKGFNKAVEKYPEIKIAERVVADFNRAKAREITLQLIGKGLSIDAVFAHNDAMILGAIQAFESANVPKPSIFVGFDAIPEALAAIKEKRLTATIAQKPEFMGWIAIQNAARVLRKENLPKLTLVDLKMVIMKD